MRFTSGNDVVMVRAVKDALTLRFRQMRRLFTREDGRFLHVHKVLGSIVLAHFAYRLALWTTTGDMDLERRTWSQLALYGVHAVLHVTSFQFHVPERRNARYNVIWPEMRWHTLLFAYRSIAVLLLHWWYPALVTTMATTATTATTPNMTYIVTCIRCAVVFCTMLGADLVTLSYRQRMTTRNDEDASLDTSRRTSMTMRNNPYPEYAGPRFVRALNLFYSVSQVLATMNVMTSPRMDQVFLTLLPIQTAPFLMTLEKKGVITQAGWHLAYALSLVLNYALALPRSRSSLSRDDGVVTSPEGGVCFGLGLTREAYLTLAALFVLGRFRYCLNKYALWAYVGASLLFHGNRRSC